MFSSFHFRFWSIHLLDWNFWVLNQQLPKSLGARVQFTLHPVPFHRSTPSPVKHSRRRLLTTPHKLVADFLISQSLSLSPLFVFVVVLLLFLDRDRFLGFPLPHPPPSSPSPSPWRRGTEPLSTGSTATPSATSAPRPPPPPTPAEAAEGRWSSSWTPRCFDRIGPTPPSAPTTPGALGLRAPSLALCFPVSLSILRLIGATG